MMNNIDLLIFRISEKNFLSKVAKITSPVKINRRKTMDGASSRDRDGREIGIIYTL